MTHVIVLSGYAGVGKDTFANHLVKRHGYIKLAFADKLKDLLLAANPAIEGRDSNRIYLADLVRKWGWDDAKRCEPEVRRLLQDTGMAARDVLGESVWIDPVLREAKHNDRVVISDLRLPNELQSVLMAGFESVVTLRLTRSDVPPPNEHVSETTPLPRDVEVHLDSVSLDEMPQVVDRIMALITRVQQRKAGYLPTTWTSDHDYLWDTPTATKLTAQFFDELDRATT